ncbi:helix-turn-helix domain-containing protein [Nocardioides bruguierae]|uniref:Helix-turn-helix transcriptional regulator n=1 Tax=Nocardioides bruguierae TaxID=2945102 RepID=A0A9X2IDJ7_9ACTN|nr:helix-turn-helix transcriptional regulator [Nocardioides bruguierae]MCM0619821.1 helix-turn-helix transcriptional regulator [Nocardioides bruguierae]
MTDKPGHLWAVIQDWLDTFRYRPPSQRDLAKVLGVSSSSLTEYKYARNMPPPIVVVRLAREMRVPYELVLNAVLEDHGYRGESLAKTREEVMGNAEHPAATRNLVRVPSVDRPTEGIDEYDLPDDGDLDDLDDRRRPAPPGARLVTRAARTARGEGAVKQARDRQDAAGEPPADDADDFEPR